MQLALHGVIRTCPANWCRWGTMARVAWGVFRGEGGTYRRRAVEFAPLGPRNV